MKTPDFQFLRTEPVDLKRYLPVFLYLSPEFKAIQDSLQKEHERQRLAQIDVTKQFHAETATWGMAAWERMLGINVNTSVDLETRRAFVLAKLRKPESVTEAFLTELINRYIADKSGTVMCCSETYSADFNVPLLNKEDMAGMTRDVRIYIPAHIGAVYKAHTLTDAENRIAMLKSTVKTVDVYPAAVEQIKPESTFCVALAMTTTEKLTLQIGGI